jgi:chloramphenicol-sensitive protein RarD
MNKGIFYAIAAYFVWGFFPIYFKALQEVPADQILAHRIFWSFIFLSIFILARREFGRLRGLATRRILLVYFAAGVLLTVNWGTYVWAVNAGHVVEGSLGYFINPLVSVLLGVVFVREKLRPLQWLPVGLAALGVAYLTISLGQLPWISLVLAFTFGLYGLIKKLAPLNSLHGLTLETAAVFLPALAFLLFQEVRGTGSFAHASAGATILLILAGPLTITPLILFASGLRLIPLSTAGFLQYVSPTIQFLIGVLIYHEPFDTRRLIGFSIIWLALIIFSADGFLAQRRERNGAARLPHQVEERATP